MGRDWGADDYKGWTRFGLCTEKNERAENEKTAINDKKFQMNWEGRDQLERVIGLLLNDLNSS